MFVLKRPASNSLIFSLTYLAPSFPSSLYFLEEESHGGICLPWTGHRALLDGSAHLHSHMPSGPKQILTSPSYISLTLLMLFPPPGIHFCILSFSLAKSYLNFKMQLKRQACPHLWHSHAPPAPKIFLWWHVGNYYSTSASPHLICVLLKSRDFLFHLIISSNQQSLEHGEAQMLLLFNGGESPEVGVSERIGLCVFSCQQCHASFHCFGLFFTIFNFFWILNNISRGHITLLLLLKGGLLYLKYKKILANIPYNHNNS